MSAGKLTSASAVQTLYTNHHQWLCSWLRRKLGCAHNAADLAHDTFVRVIAARNAHALKEPRAYLTTIARGLVIDHWRRQDLERAYLETIATLPEALARSPEERLLMLEALIRIDTLLDGLPPKVRMAFLLSRLEDLSYAEVAAQLNVSVSSVEKYMATALRHCIDVQSRT